MNGFHWPSYLFGFFSGLLAFWTWAIVRFMHKEKRRQDVERQRLKRELNDI